MRVIAGTARGRPLRPVPGSGTRPITDRVKEALFNIVGADVVGSSWWDVFAGTGAVGIEALSRSAKQVRFTDRNQLAIETTKANLATLGFSGAAETRRGDAFAMLGAQPDASFDYIFIAPPQYKDLWSRALRALDQNTGWLTSDGWVIVQIDPKEFSATALEYLNNFDSRRYGTTQLLFYRLAAG